MGRCWFRLTVSPNRKNPIVGTRQYLSILVVGSEGTTTRTVVHFILKTVTSCILSNRYQFKKSSHCGSNNMVSSLVNGRLWVSVFATIDIVAKAELSEIHPFYNGILEYLRNQITLPSQRIVPACNQQQFPIVSYGPVHNRHTTDHCSNNEGGRVTPSEREWLMKQHTRNLVSNNPYMQDYYYTTMKFREMASAREAQLAATGHTTIPDPLCLLPSPITVDHIATGIDPAKDGMPPMYSPSQFENSLGILTTSNVNTPRQTIQLPPRHRVVVAAAPVIDARQDMYRPIRCQRELLSVIESSIVRCSESMRSTSPLPRCSWSSIIAGPYSSSTEVTCSICSWTLSTATHSSFNCSPWRRASGSWHRSSPIYQFQPSSTPSRPCSHESGPGAGRPISEGERAWNGTRVQLPRLFHFFYIYYNYFITTFILPTMLFHIIHFIVYIIDVVHTHDPYLRLFSMGLMVVFRSLYHLQCCCRTSIIIFYCSKAPCPRRPRVVTA